MLWPLPRFLCRAMEVLATLWNAWRRNFGQFPRQGVQHGVPLRAIAGAIPAYVCMFLGSGCRLRSVPKAHRRRGAGTRQPLEEERIEMLAEHLRDRPVVFGEGRLHRS